MKNFFIDLKISLIVIIDRFLSKFAHVQHIMEIETPGQAQGKLISVARKFGNLGLQKQQGTTRIIFDTLPMDTRTTYRFFRNNNRELPLSNIGQRGGELSVGEAMTFQRAYLAIMEIDPDDGTVGSFSQIENDDIPELTAGTVSLTIANTIVMKPIALASFFATFNKNAYWERYSNFELDTNLVLQPLIEFEMTIEVNEPIAAADTFLRLTVEGIGSILSPRNTV